MKRHFLLLIFYIFPVYLLAYTPIFRTLTVADGLPESTANVLFKDDRGFVWIGTHNGLCRFDGIRVKVYPDFKKETIRTICQTDSITLWVGSLSGLKSMNLMTGEVREIVLPDQKTLPEVYSLLPVGNDKIYICTVSGIYVYEREGLRHIQISPNSFSGENVVMNMCMDEEGELWVMTLGGLFHYSPQEDEFTRYSEVIPHPVPVNYASMGICKNRLYIGIEAVGLWVFNLEQKEMEAPVELKDKNIRGISCQDSVLYIATGTGLKLLSVRSGQVIKTIKRDEYGNNGLKSNSIYSFLIDGDELWISAFSGGVSYTHLKEPDFKVYSCMDVKFTTFNRNVRSAYVDRTGNTFIGTRDGLYYISHDQKELKYFTTQNTPGLSSNTILFLYPYGEDVLVGTYSGLYLLKTTDFSFTSFVAEESLGNKTYFCVVPDANGNLWFGLSGGVLCYSTEQGEIKHYTSEHSSVFRSDVHTIECDSKGRIWAGGINGVALIDVSNGKVADNFLPADMQRKLQDVRCVTKDSRQNLWICTSKDGVFKVNELLTGFMHYTTQNLLPDNVIYSAIEDREGYLWIATLKGMVMYNDETGEKQVFDLSDGLPGYVFTLFRHMDEEGYIWWGNENGLIYCDPAEVRLSASEKREIAITDLYINGKEQEFVNDAQKGRVLPDFVTSVHLPASKNNISFFVSQLSYAIAKGSYEYILEGYENDWHKIFDNNEISYSDLPPGSYTLLIRKQGEDGGREISIVIERSFTGVVFVAVCLLLLALLFYFANGYLKSLKRNKAHSLKSESLLVNEETDAQSQKEKYSSSKLQQAKMEEIHAQLVAYMETEKPYLNPQLKLSDVAAAISCSPTYLSQCISQELNTSFSDLINSYRIAQFKEKVKHEDVSKYTLFALAELCGFSSRTSFFRIFKKQTGLSPLEYIKKKGVDLLNSED